MNTLKIALTISMLLFFVSVVSASNQQIDGVTNTAWTLSVQTGGGGSSSGSGGMGVSSDEPYANIAFSDRAEKYWYFNTTSLYSFRYEVYEVAVLPAQNEGAVMLKLEILKDKSARTTVAPAGSVYQYFNLYSGSKRFSEVTIRFKVPITWTAETVTLMQWTGTEWKSLIMKSLGDDASYRYYEAYTNTFSNFAIVGYVPAPAPPAPAPAPPAPVVATPLPTTEITDLTNASQPFKIPFPISGLELVMVLCLVGLWYRKK